MEYHKTEEWKRLERFEQEAEAWMERFRRVWNLSNIKFTPPDPHYGGIEFSGTLLAGDESMKFLYDFEDDEFVYIIVATKDLSQWLRYDAGFGEPQYGASEYGNRAINMVEAETQRAFIEQWLPFFRRGCWLSGFDIQATAHEKAEWIQDFTREETGWWDLKF